MQMADNILSPTGWKVVQYIDFKFKKRHNWTCKWCDELARSLLCVNLIIKSYQKKAGIMKSCSYVQRFMNVREDRIFLCARNQHSLTVLSRYQKSRVVGRTSAFNALKKLTEEEYIEKHGERQNAFYVKKSTGIW